jgi:Family of unknown function (DUF6599)
VLGSELALKHPMMRHLVLVLFFGAISQTAFGDVAGALASIQEQTAWKTLHGPKEEVFDRKTLSRYRPHDSAIIIEYGFAKLTKAQLIHPEQKPLTLAIYEMLDSAAAYGLFTYLRPPTAKSLTGIGSAGTENVREISFHQSNYYVVLSSEAADTESRSAMLQVSGAISKSLPNDFSIPMVASKLPTENRVPRSEKFLMGAEALSQLLPLGDKDPFGLSTGAEAAMAKYEQAGRESATLLLIHYPTQQLARHMLEAGYRQYSSRHPDQTAFYKRDGPMVVLVLASNSPELATTLLEKVSYVSMVSWDPKVEPPNIAQVMVNIFIFCGIMLSITFAAGFTFGIARIVIKRLFPGKVFDRPESMEVIRLHLGEKPQKPR